MIEKVLILAPHTDDGEFGCGATIQKMIREGKEVFYVAFSAAEESVPAHLPRDILRTEIKDATAVLGIKPQNLEVLNFPVRNFPAHRQAILEKIIDYRTEIAPDTVFVPALSDMHQDHEVIAREGFRAFKKKSVIGYELPFNNLHFNSNMYIKLQREDVERKMDSISCYKSQLHRPYSNLDFILHHAMIRGSQVGVDYAETFELIRWVI